MNKNDKSFMAQRIRAQYVEKEATELGALRRLDAAVKRPADIFAYAFGGVGGTLAALAYPTYNRVLARERKRIAPEIIKLTDELLK